MKADNKEASIHFLTTTEQLFFTNVLNNIRNRIGKICEEQQLDGNWTLSEDCKFLVRIEGK